MDALKAVANCAGHTSEAIKIESDLIKAIVEDVQKQLIDMSPIIKSANLVGMGSRILEVERLLAMDALDDTRIIGLWGMGGVGKITLAKACYGRITSSYKGIKHLFIRNITEICEKHHWVEEVVCKLYSKLLNENDIDYEDLDITYRRKRLSRMRVFIILDNVETLQQLEQLGLGDVSNLTKIFAPGSRIIVTTRNKKMLQNAKTKIYDLECLNDEESTQLFSLHVFKQGFPQDNWTEVKSWPTLFLDPLKLVDTILLRRKKRKVVDMNWKVYNPLEEYRTTEGISLYLPKAKEMYLEANAFDGMNSLTFLKLWGYYKKKKFHLPCGGLDSLPNGLRWLQWDHYPSKFLPSKFHPQHLVHLIITHSPIQRCWRGYDQLKSLPKNIWNIVSRELLIQGSPLLKTFPEISESIYCLTDYGSLKSLPSSINNIRSLESLDLSRTGKLLKLKNLMFEDCTQLDKTIPVEIVANFLVRASLTPVHKVDFQLSGSELPEWFSHRSMNLNEAEDAL
ncbi:Disease resistance-like protein DSC1 [Linum perenne]